MVLKINKLYSNLLKNPCLLPDDREELKKFSPSEISNKFIQPVRFGKAGFRAEIGLGSNLFNRYTIKQIICAFVHLLKKSKKKQTPYSVLLFGDSRHQSASTIHYVADILSHFNIQVILITDSFLAPTPFLNYLLNVNYADFGIMITSSHQKKTTNGCKIFLQNYGLANKEFVDQLNQLIQKNHLLYWSYSLVPQKNLIKKVSFMNEKKNYLNLIMHRLQDDKLKFFPLKIIYSSVYGTCWGWTDTILRARGHQVILEKEQCRYDPDFPTASDPNPENPASFSLSLKLARENLADLVIINDPDGDRMRVAVRSKNDYQLLTGNEIGAIFLYYLINERNRRGKIFTTAVSTSLISLIAQDYQCQLVETLTGFVNLTQNFLRFSPKDFLFAFEESLGFLPDRTIGNDKDGVQSGFLIAEIAAWLKQKNQNLLDYLEEISNKYGYFGYWTKKLPLQSHYQVQNLITHIKKMNHFGEDKIVKMINYSSLGDGNLFKAHFAPNFWLAFRPSVTEPLFKFYLVFRGQNQEETNAKLTELTAAWQKTFANFFQKTHLK